MFTASMADKVMEQILSRNPWLNPQGQLFSGAQTNGATGGGTGLNNTSINSSFVMPLVMGSMGNTKVCTEPQPHLYLPENTISSDKKVTEKNINLPCYVLGYLRYLIAVCEGRQSKISSAEFLARLNGLANVVEIVVTNSSTTEHMTTAWQIAREYSNRVFADVEQGRKTWESMSKSMQTESYILAKDQLEVSLRNKPPTSVKTNDKEKDKKPDKAPFAQTCYNYNNVHNEGNVCAFELSNAGMRCMRLHACSTCLPKGNQRCHRALECRARGPNSAQPFSDRE